MEKIKAIVLSCDRYQPFARHTIAKYRELWPNHPFHFRLPYQELSPDEHPEQSWIKTDSAFHSTVLTLINDLPDDEWIYWCIDDKYPIKLQLPEIDRVLEFVRSEDSSSVSGVCFCRCRTWNENPSATLTACTETGLLERTTWNHIWLHQFLRAGVLRHLFSQMPVELKNAKEMDQAKFRVPKLSEHRLLVTENNHAVFGESTSRGKITANCVESFESRDLETPKSFLPAAPAAIMGQFIADKS